MAQKVFLSSKQVFLDIKETPEHENFLFKQIFDSLLKPTKIVENGEETVVGEGKELSLTPRGKMNLSGGRKGYIIAINHGRSGICGLFFYVLSSGKKVFFCHQDQKLIAERVCRGNIAGSVFLRDLVGNEIDLSIDLGERQLAQRHTGAQDLDLFFRFGDSLRKALVGGTVYIGNDAVCRDLFAVIVIVITRARYVG